MEIINEAKPVTLEYQDFLRRKVASFVPIAGGRHHKQELLTRNFFVSEKADGTRYLLFIHCIPGEGSQTIQECFLVDRKNTYYYFPYFFPNSKAQGGRPLDNTLLDGELIFDKIPGLNTVKPRFLVFDLILLEGVDVSQRPFHVRLGKLNEFVLKPLHEFQKTHHLSVPMTMELKKVEVSYGLCKVLDEIPQLHHGNDGLIFTDSNSPYTFGTCEAMVKWKPPEMNTIDFKLRFSQGRIYLDVLVRDSQFQEFAEFTPPDQSWYSREHELNGKIAECKFSNNRWEFMRFREDKNTPNHVSVVPKIIQSINEGISSDELTQTEFLQEIRKRWKERNK